MSKIVRPVIVVSKCLTGAKCRYDGVSRDNSFVRGLRDYARLTAVCPEMEIGLGCPRDRIIVVPTRSDTTLHQPATGRNLTRQMTAFSRRYLNALGEVDGFLLKSKSPSCGLRDCKWFETADENARIVARGPGLFAREVLRQHPDLPLEDERRTQQRRIREHWLTVVFARAAFRRIKKNRSYSALRTFHDKNRDLLRLYSRKHERLLDQLISEPSAPTATTLINTYEQLFTAAFKKRPRRGSARPMLLAALAHYSPNLWKKDKRDFEKALELYSEGQWELGDIIKTVQIWAVRYDKTFTRQQTFWQPYPRQLLNT